MGKAVGITLLVLFLGPASALVMLGLLANPAAQASCAPGTTTTVANVPEHLTAITANGTQVDLNKAQLTHAATIITVGGQTPGVGQRGVKVALMAALTESTLRMLSNRSAYPESVMFPNDGDGGDHDSLGLFQMRPSTGWGTVQQLMDPDYQARAFFGGDGGPNAGSPRALLDIPSWQSMSPGAAAQAVEVSAYPDRYANYEPVAEKILATLTAPPAATGTSGTVPESTRLVFPLPQGTWVKTDTFGPRIDPITGQASTHTGVDYAATAGTPILAVADGRVVFAGPVSSGYAHLILIEHTIGGKTVVSGYAHMYADGLHVAVGDRVTAGQHIADVGADGKATGPHLHFEIRPGGPDASPVDPEPWLRGSSETTEVANASGQCASQAVPAAYTGGNPDELIDDPTTDGKITRRTAYILAQIQARYPSTSWACWRGGNSPEHPSGRACDGTFGNSIGQAATGDALRLGWEVTNWLKANAQTLGVEYLIWQGRIWSVARANEGWRPYDGGGLHDPNSITGGHYDHLHYTSVTGSSGSA